MPVPTANVAAERVRHEVGWHDAVTLLHHEERRAEHAGIALEPVHAGNGNRRVQRDLAHGLELTFEVVLAEHGDVRGVRRNAGDERLGALGALLVEDGIEEQRLRRHPVGRGNIELGDADAVGVGAPGASHASRKRDGCLRVAGERLRSAQPPPAARRPCPRLASRPPWWTTTLPSGFSGADATAELGRSDRRTTSSSRCDTARSLARPRRSTLELSLARVTGGSRAGRHQDERLFTGRS